MPTWLMKKPVQIPFLQYIWTNENITSYQYFQIEDELKLAVLNWFENIGGEFFLLQWKTLLYSVINYSIRLDNTSKNDLCYVYVVQ